MLLAKNITFDITIARPRSSIATRLTLLLTRSGAEFLG